MSTLNRSCDDSDVLDDLRRLVPPPPVVDLARQTQDRMIAEIAARVRAERAREDRAQHRRTRALAWASPVLVTVCLVMVVVLAVSGLSSTGPTQHTTPLRLDVVADADAVSVLRDMSAVALRTRAPAVRADQFVYVRSEALTNEGAFGRRVRLSRPHERQVWLSQSTDPDDEHLGLIREFGQDWPIETSGSAPVGLSRPTYAWLSDLPTDPDALLAKLRRELPPGAGQGADQHLFDAIGDLVSESLLPPRTAAALYQAVTRIPGVRIDERARDAIGRKGVGITRTDTRFRVRSEWVFRPGSDELLGTRSFFTGTPQGDVLFGATAVLQRGVADRSGTAPGVRG